MKSYSRLLPIFPAFFPLLLLESIGTADLAAPPSQQTRWDRPSARASFHCIPSVPDSALCPYSVQFRWLTPWREPVCDLPPLLLAPGAGAAPWRAAQIPSRRASRARTQRAAAGQLPPLLCRRGLVPRAWLAQSDLSQALHSRSGPGWFPFPLFGVLLFFAVTVFRRCWKGWARALRLHLPAAPSLRGRWALARLLSPPWRQLGGFLSMCPKRSLSSSFRFSDLGGSVPVTSPGGLRHRSHTFAFYADDGPVKLLFCSRELCGHEPARCEGHGFVSAPSTPPGTDRLRGRLGRPERPSSGWAPAGAPPATSLSLRGQVRLLLPETPLTFLWLTSLLGPPPTCRRWEFLTVASSLLPAHGPAARTQTVASVPVRVAV